MDHHYSKLVRDRVPDIIRRRGGKVVAHLAGSDQEYWHKLKEKLQEEFDQFSKNETIENYADVVEVLAAIKLFKNFDERDISVIREHKKREKGAYEKRTIIESSSEELGLDNARLM